MTEKPNKDIRAEIFNHSLRNWQVARVMGVHETTLCRWLREEMPPERKERVRKAIRKLAGGE